jgi:hypothetical protein
MARNGPDLFFFRNVTTPFRARPAERTNVGIAGGGGVW